MRNAGGARFLSNARALMGVQLISYALPLLLIPHLTRSLGVELYGVVALGIAFAQVSGVLIDFGFNLSGTYKVASACGRMPEVEALYSAVTASKAMLLFVTLVLSCTALGLDEGLVDHRLFFLSMLVSVAGQAFQPSWLLQGLERMSVVTMYTLVSRGTFCAGVFVMVRGPDDLYWVSAVNGIGHLLAALIGTMVVSNMGYRLGMPRFSEVAEAMRESAPFFLSRAAVMTYTSGATLVLGAFAGPVEVARYAVAEQLYRGAQGLYASIPQALFPNMARDKDFRLLSRVLAVVLVVGAVGALIGVLVGKQLLGLLFGDEFTGSYLVLVVFIAALYTTMPSTLLGYPLMSAVGKLEIANRSVVLAGAVQIMALGVLCISGNASALGIAGCVLVTELFVLSYRIFYAMQEPVWELRPIE